MKKKLLSTPRNFQHFNRSLIAFQLNYLKAISYKIFLPVFLFFLSNFMYGQATITHTFDTNNSVIVPNGLTSMNIQAWGGGGSGGGASNLPTLQGRSGSGGGAGARATATITVVPGTTISALVATAVSGTAGANGTAGNSSTISGFQSFINASGGSGGLANTTGNASYAGGAGGSTGAGTVTAGGNGGQGFTSGLAALFTSGAGGNSPGFTNGGASHTSVVGGVNENGNPGGIPGGGGSGGIITNAGEVRAGGAGGAGRVIIGYTCPTYSINSTSAAGACVSTGTSLVTLTGPAANLPVGTYTVTYNRTNPTGTNLTATMTVSTAGTATFTAVGFTTVGTSTVTIVSIRSQDCVSTVNSGNNSANVIVSALSVGGSISGGSTICSGGNSATLTLSGHTGTVLRWQYAIAPFTTWVDIASTTSTAYVFTALTQTIRFRAVVANGTCAEAISSEAIVTVNPLPQGNLTANGPFCVTGAGQLTFTASAGTGPYTVVYNDGTADRTVTGVVSGTPFNTFTTPVTATTTYTLVSVTGANTCVRNTGFTGPSAIITVNPLPQGSLTANGPFCATGASQLTFTASAGTGPYTVVYNDGTANRTATGVVSGTPFNTFTTPITGTTTYTLVSVTGANTCVRNTAFTGASATITVNPLPQGSLTANGPFCATGAGQLTFTASAGTGPYTVVYNDGTADRTVNNVVSGTPFNTFTTPVTGTTTYTLVSVTGANTCVRNTAFTGASATITVNPLPQGSLTANGPFCVTGAGQLTFTASAGTGPYTVVYNDGTANRTASNVTSGTPFAVFTTPVTGTTTYTLVSVTGANTCVRNTAFTGASATITVNPLPQGSLTANGPFCATGAGQLTFTASAGTGPYTVVYNDGTADRTATGVVSGTPFNTFTTPVTGTTTYTLVSVTGANTCVRNTGFTGASATITVNPLPQGSLTANGPFCATGAGQLTFTASAGAGPYTIVYNDGTADRTVNNVVSGTPFNTFTTPVTGTTTYTLVSVTGANTCVRNTGFTGPSATITVNPLPQGTLSAVSPLCGSGAGQLTFTATAGTGPYTVVYTENGGVNRTATGVVSGTAFTPFTTPVTGTTTYALVSVTGANSCVRNTGFTGGSATITVNPLPQGTLSAVSPLCGSGAGQLTFTASAGTGPYTIVYTENGGTNRTATGVVSGTAFTPFTTPVTGTTTYALVSVTGANSCIRNSGFTGGSAVITVIPKPATPTTGTIVQPTCVNPTGSITLNGLLNPASWTITQSNGTVSQTYTGSGPNFTITNLAPGTYTFTIHENSLCPSNPTAAIEILAPVTNTWNGTVWSKGSEPVLTDAIRFSGNYSTTGSLSGCSCMVDPGVNVTVNSNHTLTITNAVTNNGGTLTFENNSSLLQTTNAVNTGNIIYKRNTTTRRYDYTYWSSPVVRAPIPFTMHDLSPNTLADKYTSYNPNASWVIHFGGNVEMVPGQGYSIRGPQDFDIVTPATQLVSFVGVPNNGPISVPLVTAERFHLIGNPYPSAVYADQFILDNTANLYGTLYFWTHNTAPAGDGSGKYKYNSSDYATYNMTGSTGTGTGATSPGNQTAPLGYIAAGQAFFAKSKTTSPVVFNNNMRVPGNNSQFYKTNNTAKINLERHRVWLNLTNTEGAFKQLLIGYIEGATNSWDQNYDALSFNGNRYLDFYSINEGQNLSIQGRALPFNNSDVIPLGYESTIQGEFSISIDRTDGVLSNQEIYLEDKVANKIHNLQTSNYKFTTAIGKFPERFVLKYANTTLGTDDFEGQNNGFYVSVKDKTIQLNSSTNIMREVSIFDVSGKLLYNNKKVENTELQISNFQSGNQVLIVKVTLENGNMITKKIIF